MAGILAIGSASMAEMLSLRRVHSPASQQGQREQAAEHGAHAGAEQAGLDRIAHHEEAAERQRQSADPHHPAGADAFPRSRGRAAASGGGGAARRWRLLCRLGGRGGRDGFGVAERWAAAAGATAGRGRRQGLLERLKRRERRRHGRRGGRRCRLDRLQPRAQLRDLVHGLPRDDQGDDRDHEREENEGVVEHLASRRARQSVNRPRPRPGCNPVCSLPLKVQITAGNVQLATTMRVISQLWRYSRSSWNGRPSTVMLPGPFRRARAASGPRAPAPCRRG